MIIAKKWFFAFSLVAVALFSLLRLSHLSQKLYWSDEVASSLRITGFTQAGFGDTLHRHSLKNLKELTDLFRVSPESTAKETLVSLVQDDPHHSPAYYLVARFWAAMGDASPGFLRLLSALLSLATLPIFFLCSVTLFGSAVYGVVSIFLFALSPIFLIYAQQAREYGPWIFLISTASLFLLRRQWLAYFLSIAVALYVHVLTLPLLIAHGIYVFLTERRVFKDFAVAAGMALLTYLPWLALILKNWHQVEVLNGGLTEKISFSLYIQTLVLNFCRSILDFNLPSYQSWPVRDFVPFASLMVVLVLIVSGLVIAFRRLARGPQIFLLCSFGATLLPFVLLDLSLGGRRALLPRYLMPTWFALNLLLTFALGEWLSKASIRKRVYAVVALLLIGAAGIYSQDVFFKHSTWWTTRPPQLAETALYLRAEDPTIPLIISTSSDQWAVISLAYFLHPETPLVQFNDGDRLVFPAPYKTGFLYRPSESVISGLIHDDQLRVLQKTNSLWQISSLVPPLTP